MLCGQKRISLGIHLVGVEVKLCVTNRAETDEGSRGEEAPDPDPHHARCAFKQDGVLCNIARVLLFLETFIDEIPEWIQDSQDAEEETIPSKRIAVVNEPKCNQQGFINDCEDDCNFVANEGKWHQESKSDEKA